MINSITITEQWKLNQSKTYYIIQNPKINYKSKKIDGLEVKIVEYNVVDLGASAIKFEKINKLKNKRFPDFLLFNTQYADAENEIFVEKSKKNVKSYSIFNYDKAAKYQKLVRLHRLAEQIAGLYKVLKSESKTDIPEKDVLSIEDMGKYFKLIQDTGYFDDLEKIQTEFPDIAAL